MIEIADYEQDVLERLGLFDRDIVVLLPRMTMILTESC